MNQQRPPHDFDALFSAMASRVFAIGYQLTGDASVAEDVMQETFVAAFRGLRRFRGDAAIETWVFRIAVNEAKRAAKKRRRQGQLDRAASRQAVDAGGADLEHADAESLYAALDRLPEHQREALSLLAVRGIPADVVATILGVPVGTVYSRAHAGRARLRGMLGGFGDATGTEPSRPAGIGHAQASRAPGSG